MSSDPLDTRDKLLHAADSLSACLAKKADEDAYQWCLAILDGLHAAEVKHRVRYENAISEMRRLAGEGGR